MENKEGNKEEADILVKYFSWDTYQECGHYFSTHTLASKIPEKGPTRVPLSSYTLFFKKEFSFRKF